MKKIIIILTAITLLTACNHEPGGGPIPATISIGAPPAWTMAGGGDTRAYADPATGKTVWQEGDELYLTVTYHTAAGDPVGSPQTATAICGAGGSWSIADGDIAWPVSGEIAYADVTAEYIGILSYFFEPGFVGGATGVKYGAPINITFGPEAHRSVAIAFENMNVDDNVFITGAGTATANAAGTLTIYIVPGDGATGITGTVTKAGVTTAFTIAWGDENPLGNIYPVTTSIAGGTTGPDDLEKVVAETARFIAWADRVRAGDRALAYTQTADIDLSEVGDWVPIGSFEGKFDGGGHTISGLVVNGAANNQGLFGTLRYDAVVTDVVLRNPAITNTGGLFTGALAGQAMYATISRCRVIGGSVTGGDFFTGGLIGQSQDCHIVDCSVEGTTVTGSRTVGGLAGESTSDSRIIACTASGSVAATADNAGGLAGGNANSTIGFCIGTATVTSGGAAGGLAGGNAGIVTSCRATGHVTGNSEGVTGSLAGTNDNAGTNIVSYCNATGTATPGGRMTGSQYGGGGNTTGNTAHTDPAEILATLRNAAVADISGVRMVVAGTTTVGSYTFKRDIWNADLSLDMTKAVRE